MADLKIAQVGCGGMGLRHLYGEVELQQRADSFDVVAVCDLNRSAAEHVANEAEKGLGRRPKVYTDFQEMLDAERDLDAVDIVTDMGLHHRLATMAFDAGLNVAVEKPMGVTVRACLRMMEAAERAGKVLIVEENHRRDPVNRLVKAVLDSGALGAPRLMHAASLGGTRSLPHGTAWRHIKNRGGFLLDYGVHDTDLFLYFLGEIESVFAETRLWEPVRQTAQHHAAEPESWGLADYYAHRVKEEVELAETLECTSEDMSLGLVRFRSGAIGYYGKSIAAPGQLLDTDVIYCGEGSIQLPGSRSGRPARITRLGETEPMSDEEVLALVPGFEVDDLTAAFFDGRRRINSYEYRGPDIDRKFIAMGLKELAESIEHGRQPEMSGQVGLDAVALCYAFLESGHSGQPAPFADVSCDRVNAYQREVNEHAGI
jgi:predicted dehydrogenase